MLLAERVVTVVITLVITVVITVVITLMTAEITLITSAEMRSHSQRQAPRRRRRVSGQGAVGLGAPRVESAAHQTVHEHDVHFDGLARMARVCAVSIACFFV